MSDPVHRSPERSPSADTMSVAEKLAADLGGHTMVARYELGDAGSARDCGASGSRPGGRLPSFIAARPES